MKYINRAILANLYHRPLKLGRLMSSKGNTPTTIKILFPWQLTLFQSPLLYFNLFAIFSTKKH